MQLLAAFLVPFFTAIATFLAQYFTRKAAVSVAMVAAVAAVTAGFYAGVQALLQGIAAGINDPDIVMIWWSVWPTNGATCISACVGADVAGFLWRYQKKMIETIAAL